MTTAMNGGPGRAAGLRPDLLPCPICRTFHCRCHTELLHEHEDHDRNQPSWSQAIAANA
jgi:hypothetical protein